MFTPANLFLTIIFSTIGLAAVVYGKKAGLLYPMLFGAALMIYPYFITQTWLVYGLGIVLTALLVRFREQ